MAQNSIPKSAWKRRLDQWPEDPGRPKVPPFDITLKMLPTILRLRSSLRKARKLGREPIDEVFSSLEPGPVLGVPLGGLGGGTITRGWQGDFVRFQLRPGWYQYNPIHANQFSVYVRKDGEQRGHPTVLLPERPEGGFSGWSWDLNPKKATYHALYPRAWTNYEDIAPGINLTCRQISPFLPNNYQESATPAGVFVYTIENKSKQAATVGLMLTWQNGFGYLGPYSEAEGQLENDRLGGHHNEAFREDASGGEVIGVLLHHKHHQRGWPGEDADAESAHRYEDPLTFAIAAQAAPGVQVTYRTRFVTSSSGMDVWGDFREDGHLENTDDHKLSVEGMAIGAAVAATVEVLPGETREVAFALAWDMPVARFGAGRGWYRRYTRFYGRDGTAAAAIARDALVHYPEWEQAIEAWQKPILDQTGLPDWYKAALFNELYYIADGGTVWTDGDPIAPEGEPPEVTERRTVAPAHPEWGHFGYLEGHEYRMVNTYDVHFYASWALIQLFPELQKSLQRDFASCIGIEDDEMMRFAGTGRHAARKEKGQVPHDLGGPAEDPWYKVNAYYFQDSNQWKDLNLCFALQVYRDYRVTQDKDYLREMWPAVQAAMEHIEQWDLDSDGLIENDGPDQTFDTWAMVGPSAYCGGLWLAALTACAAIADALDDATSAQRYRDKLEKGKDAYEDLLWNEEYYSYDVRPGRAGSVIMAAQMTGQWYARACGLDPIVPSEHAQSALKTVYRFNVKQFEEGEMGAVNGMYPEGRVDTSTMQSQEVWPGVTYALAAAMLYEGLYDEAFATAKGIAAMTYGDLGLWFATPEAWNSEGDYRSFAYMRPLSIWAIQWAWERTR